MPDQDETPKGGAEALPAPVAVRADADIARELTGNLPCVTCRYNLRGLSIKSVCPECGSAVRAAILAAVDPYAPILQPLYAPRLTAAGLLLWSGGALAAGLLTWWLRLGDLLATLLDRGIPAHGAAVLAVVCIVLSGIGAVALVRPHPRTPIAGTIGAIAGVIATFALAPVYARLHLEFDPAHTRPYFQMAGSLPERSVLRLIEAGLLLVIIFGLRPNARLLAARALLLRLGRVDRQAMLAMGAAVVLGAAGDALNLLTWQLFPRAAGVTEPAALFLIVVGSMLLTLGLIGVFVDAVRIAPVLLNPHPAPSQVVGAPPSVAARPRTGGAQEPA